MPMLGILLLNKKGESIVLFATYSYGIPLEKEVRRPPWYRLFNFSQGTKDDGSMETEAWYNLALLYLSLSQWRDTELCISKIKAASSYSPLAYHATGASYSPYHQLPHSQESLHRVDTKTCSVVHKETPILHRKTKFILNIYERCLSMQESYLKQEGF